MTVKTIVRGMARLGIVLSMVLLGSAIVRSPAHSQGLPWSDLVNLGYGWFPDVTADRAGGLHVVWSSGRIGTDRTTYDTVMYVTAQNGGDWSEPKDVMALPERGGAYATRPTLLTDSQGFLHMTYRDASIYYSRAFIQLAGNASSWASPFVVSEVGYYSRLAHDGKGRLHLVYTEDAPMAGCATCSSLVYRYSEDEGHTWSEPMNLSLASTFAAKPHLLIDLQDNLHLVWEASDNGAQESRFVNYAVSRDQGVSWTRPYRFESSTAQATNIALGVDNLGQLVVAWLGVPDDLIYTQVSKDGGRSWSKPEPVPSVWGGWSVYQARFDDYDMATDSAGNVHLVLVGRRNPTQTSLEVLSLVWNGVVWSMSDIVAAYEGDVPEWPRLSIGNGNQLHLVWFVRNKAAIFDSNNAQYQVWYAHGVADALAIPPIAWPTPAPATPSATATPGAATIATATSGPTVQPLASGSPVSFYSETSYLITAAESIVPVLALLLVVIVVVRLRRR